MDTAVEMLRHGRKAEIWKQYCGFLDMDIGQYMAVQKRLLEEQLPRLCACQLGRIVMKGAAPRTLEEFRATVPFTTYKDYEEIFAARKEDSLPEKPFVWVHTSGMSGEYDFKWVPYSRAMFDIMGQAAIGCLVIAAAKARGEVCLHKGMRFPYTIAPPPYLSGITLDSLLQSFPFVMSPDFESGRDMDFKQRIQEALKCSLDGGMDFFFGVSSILLKISQSFTQMNGRTSIAKLLSKPRTLLRLVQGMIKSRLKGEPLQPKHLWKVKAILCGGMDTEVYRQRVSDSWGMEPAEMYACTEFGMFSIQSWTRRGLTFFPNMDLLEFITEKDYRELAANPRFTPRSYTMDEVTPGTEYVLVGTNFHGGALVRYIIGDLVRVVSLEDKEAGVRLPQFTFVSRIDDVIDIGGFTRLTEKTIWLAIENSRIPYEEWTIRKESRGDKPVLHLYLELKNGSGREEAIAAAIHNCLKELDTPYRELEEMTGLKPLELTTLSKGTFQRYYEERQAAGADLAHLKPPHLNASDSVIDKILRMSSWKI